MRSQRGPADEQDRRLAQSEFDRPVAVIAGAGTGKTTVLVARVLGWCLGRGWTEARWRLIEGGSRDPNLSEIASHVLDGMVAITFTEAAAAEMARRVSEALATLATDATETVVGFDPQLLPDTDSATLQERASTLIGVLDHLAVRTIHSHCWNLLSTYPMAAGLSLDLQVDADGRTLDEIVREEVEQAVKRGYAGPEDHPLRRLALRMVDPRQIAEAVQTLVTEGFDAEALERDPLSLPRRQEICSRLTAAVAAVASVAAQLTEQNRAKSDRRAAEASEETLALLQQAPASLDMALLGTLLDRLREIWDDDLIKRLAAWSKGDFTKTVAELVGEGCGQLRRAASDLTDLLRLYRRIDIDALDAGRKALLPVISAVDEALKSRGVLTYSSMMTEAWRLLASHPEVRRREQRRIQQLLVDEFQDTDRMQCELVRLLALGGDKADRPGLFVVGDPKQSIYGWRDADLEAYENFLEDLRGAGGISVELSQNFRSVPSILHEVDRVIAPIMKPISGLQPEFSSLQPADSLASDPGFDRSGRVAVEYWISWDLSGPDTRADQVATLEARAIAADIRELNQVESVPWGEFGLLLRSTSRLETYLGAFRDAGVPFVVTSDKHYYRRREIIEVAALIRTIIVPVDHVALVTFLRSATVGVPDAALLPLWQRRFPDLVTSLSSPADAELQSLRAMIEEVAAQLPADIPGISRIDGWHVCLHAALENLAHLREAFNREPADRFINLVRQRFLFDITESARHLGVYRLANLDRFFRDLEVALESGGGDIQGVLRTLRRSVTSAEEAEQALPEGATEDAVQVMTIHGAKGLEFGHVYLPQLHTKGRKDQWPTTAADRRWLPGQDAEYVLFGCPTPGFDKVERRQRQVEQTEQVRTLYVAMTRARHRLVLLGNWPSIPTAVASEKQVTYLDLLRSREELPDSIEDLRVECSNQSSTWVDTAHARWRFPILDDLSTKRAGSNHKATRFPARQELKKEASRLDRLRSSADSRMERPYAEAASAEAAERLERLVREDAPPGEQRTDREVARQVGDAFHRLLEGWNLDADPSTELERQRQIQLAWLEPEIPRDLINPALERFDLLLDRFRSGRFWERFIALAGLDIAREVPVLLPPRESETGPVGYVSGFVDLIVRDPESGRWTIVDYKTDHVEEESEIEERARSYAAQEAVYARAVREALDLEYSPATELWFIWPDRLWEDTAEP